MVKNAIDVPFHLEGIKGGDDVTLATLFEIVYMGGAKDNGLVCVV